MTTAAVLGLGAVGRSLVEALPKAGIRVIALWTRSSRLQPPPLEGARLVFLSVSDAAVEPLCSALPAERGQLFVHLAGGLSLSALASAKRQGARVGSLHPLRAFTRSETGTFEGAFCGVSGSDPSARRELMGLARRLGMTPLATRDSARALYHASAVLAAGAQVALFSQAVRGLVRATGASRAEAQRALLPLTFSALDKLRTKTPAEALTGPAARGDRGTIEAHLRQLPAELRDTYLSLLRESVRLSREGRRAPRKQLDEIDALLRRSSRKRR